MATIVFTLSPVEGLQRFRDLAETLLEMHEAITPKLLDKLAEKAESLDVHRVDFQRIILEIVRDKSHLGRNVISHDDSNTEQLKLICPRCETLYNELVSDCHVCHWTFSFGFGRIVEVELQRQLKEIEIARNVWSRRDHVVTIGSFFITNKLRSTEDKQTALKWFEVDAEIGFKRAQLNLGNSYRNGSDGLSVDKKKALHWYRKSAEQGVADSENIVGQMLLQGEGCEKNPVEAMKWYSKAAEKGLAIAQYNLGCLFKVGELVAMDYQSALKWFHKAASQDFSDAQNQIGLCYHAGVGVEKNYRMANIWFIKAALNGYATGQANFATLINDGLGINKNLYLARTLYKLASNNGSNSAMEKLTKITVKAPWKVSVSERQKKIDDYQKIVIEIASLLTDIGRFDIDSETILDKKTDLMWMKSSFSEKMTWSDAVELINDFNDNQYAGYGDWRLPEKGEWIALLELGSMLGVERYFYMFLNGIGFEINQPGLHWSDGSDDEKSSFCVNLKFGGISLHKDDVKGFVLAVRG